jgi:protocatechuate 3,4-dioxygenase beta subunit
VAERVVKRASAAHIWSIVHMWRSAMSDHLDRRRVLAASLATCAALKLPEDTARAQTELMPTPACGEHDEPTVRQTEGPFFKPRSPERSDLRVPGLKGQPFELKGLVLTRNCRPVGRVLVDLWHADDAGDYDNTGFRLRGHQYTDAQGRYRFLTIVPGVYTGRTRHFHVKVQPPGGRVLTTQLYFPDEPKNRSDGLFRRELSMKVAEAGDGRAGRFDFVLDMG